MIERRARPRAADRLALSDHRDREPGGSARRRAVAPLRAAAQAAGIATWSVTSGLSAHRARRHLPRRRRTRPRRCARWHASGVARPLRLARFPSVPDQPGARAPAEGDRERLRARARARSVLLGHEVAIPSEIEKLTVRFALSLPDKDAILGIVKAEVADWQRRQRRCRAEGRARRVRPHAAALGGPAPKSTCARLVRYAFQDDGVIDSDDLPRLIAQKHEILARDSVLSFEIETARFSDVAGLAALKTWLERRRAPSSARNPAERPRRAQGHHAAGRAGLRQEPRRQGRRRRVGRAADAPRLRRALQQVPRRDRAQPARGAEGRRRDGAVRAVDRRDRKGRGAERQRRRRRRVAAHARHAADLDGRAQEPRVPRRDVERHRGAAARAGAQGPLRRDLFRRPARRQRARRRSSASICASAARIRRSSTSPRWPRPDARASPAPRSSRPWSPRSTRPTRAGRSR